jgi:Fe-S cluster assembly protein SufD
MENLKLNETPVRTAKNFRINNIKLENIEIPEVIPEFENVTITGDTSKIDIEQNADNIDINLAYGLSEELAVQVKAQANQKIKLNIKDTQNEKSKTENLEKAEAKIDFKFDDENSVLIDDIEITATENTKSTVVIKYTSNQESENYHNGIIKAKAEKDSELNIVLINLMNTKSNNFLAIENDFEENAKINYTIIDFGGKNSITNYYSNLKGDNCDNQLNTIYLGKENQLFDLNYIGELRGKKSNIDIEVQGALKDVAKKHFKGTIDFKKGCKKATGNENEACMLLSDTAKSIALPMLLCSEEEVEGNHSSSAGKIGEKELFYIMSRGFELKEAMKLMVRARFNKILENIKNEELKDEILKEIDMRLD